MKVIEQEMQSSQPEVITQIDINIVPPQIDYRELFLEDYHFCPLCGDELLYTHVTHFANKLVSEEGHCESCSVRVKNNNHTLQ